jgi:predicted regulator of Ras-like GTPase activity (Roadblock/LC7/MglB family)
VRSRRAVALTCLALVLVAMLVTPAGAHVGSMSHLWSKHMKPLATKLFYTKKQSDARYYTKSASDGRYYTQAASDARYYTTGAADARFALKDETAESGLQAYCSRASASPRSYPGEACSAPLLVTLDSGGTVGEYTSVAIGTDGLPVISYHDGTNGDLKVLHCGTESCAGGGNVATTVDVSGANDVGEHTSIAIGADGLPIVAYRDATNMDLKVLHCGNVACTAGNVSTPIDTGPANVGTDTSIAVGDDGLPIVSYVDATNADLKILHCGNAACTSGNALNVGDAGPVGSATDTSLAIGTDGLPVVSYYDGDDADLLVLHCGDALCSSGNQVTTVDGSGAVGDFSSLAIGTDGFPVVSYRDGTTGLKVAHCADVACSAGSVVNRVDETAVPIGYDTSIAIDAEGFPVVSYWDNPSNDLKLARCTDVACTEGSNDTAPLDTAGAVGRHTSLALGVDGLPVVTYYDETNGDLKLARPPVS